MYYPISKAIMLRNNQLTICKYREGGELNFKVLKWNDGFQTDLKIIEFCPLNDDGEPCRI